MTLPRIHSAPRFAACLALTALAAALGGCSSASRATTPPPSPSGRPASSLSSASPAPSASSSVPVVLDERARGTSVRVTSGTLVEVRLHGGYWSAPAGSDAQVLVPAGGGTAPTRTSACPPGRGCGVASARFTAGLPGAARVTAHRDVCGEVMRCSPGQGRYEVTVVVTR